MSSISAAISGISAVSPQPRTPDAARATMIAPVTTVKQPIDHTARVRGHGSRP